MRFTQRQLAAAGFGERMEAAMKRKMDAIRDERQFMIRAEQMNLPDEQRRQLLSLIIRTRRKQNARSAIEAFLKRNHELQGHSQTG